MVEGNEWLDTNLDGLLLLQATMGDTRRIKADESRLALNVDAARDEGFVAGVLASEQGLGRADQ